MSIIERMRQIRKGLFLLLFCMIIMIGCVTFNKEEDSNKDDEIDESSWLSDKRESTENTDLQLTVTKADEEAGVTIKNNEDYQILNDVVKSNPQLGTLDDFSMFTIDFDEEVTQNLDMITFLGINRLDEPIKNLNFNITFGNDRGEYVWENQNIDIPEETFGTFDPDHAIPIMLDITEEQLEVYQTITEENQVFSLDDFTFDTE